MAPASPGPRQPVLFTYVWWLVTWISRSAPLNDAEAFDWFLEDSVKHAGLAQRTKCRLLVENADGVPKSMRQDVLRVERINLQARQAGHSVVRDKASPRNNDVCWEVSCRNLFNQLHVYCILSLNRKLFFSITDTRAFGRDQRCEDEAQGKLVAASCFEMVDNTADGAISNRRGDTSTRGINIHHCTLADLLKARGFGPQV